MNKANNQQAGFSAVEVLLVLIIVVLIGAVGYMVYNNKSKPTKAVATTTGSKKPDQTKSDPYKGWQTATLPATKLSFKYPGTWVAKDESTPSTAGEVSDQFTMTGSNNFSINVTAVSIGHPSLDGPTRMHYAQAVTFNGQKAYLDYFGIGANLDQVGEVSLSKSATDPMDVFTGTLNGTTYNLSMFATYTDANGQFKTMSVAAAKADSNYSQLAKFVTSAKYE